MLLAPPASAACGQNGTAHPAASECGSETSGTQVRQGGDFTATGKGILPGEEAQGDVFSTPRNLGVKKVDSNGRVTFTFHTAGLGVGAHTVQITGLQSGIVLRSSFTVAAPWPPVARL